MIWEIRNGKPEEIDSLAGALGISSFRCSCTAVTGAGGKTTTLKRLAGELKKAGERPVVTTTVHMAAEDSPLFLYEPESVSRIWETVREKGIVFCGVPAPAGKMTGISSCWRRELMQRGASLLVEADGSRRLPVKVPAEHEPVIPEEATRLVYVCGLDCLGKTYGEVCFRWDLAEQLLGRRRNEQVCAEDVARLVQSAAAGKKGLHSGLEYVVVLNKADSRRRLEQALDIVRRIGDRRTMRIFITSIEEKWK